MANYYISDLHIGHENILRFDHPPFADLSEMHTAIMDRWNSVVTGNDTVYILGDFVWAKQSLWPFFVEPLAGQKVLIRGNHDPKECTRAMHRLFQDVRDYKEIDDENR
ncbi:MAG: metallophosphoesterase, partial [Raoultibacter sp.]